MKWRVSGKSREGNPTTATFDDAHGAERTVRAMIAALAATTELTTIESSGDGSEWRVELDRR